VLRNDVSSLLGDYTIKEIVELVSNYSKRKIEIKMLEDSLKNSVTDTNVLSEYLKDVRHLGHFMATGNVRSNHLFKNAHTMAYQYGKPTQENTNTTTAELIKPLLDQLATLHAMNDVSIININLFKNIANKELARGDTNGISYLIKKHQLLQRDALSELFDGNPTMMIKGYTKEIYNHHNTVVAANAAEGSKLLQEGYVRITEKVLDQDFADPEFGTKPKHLYILKGIGMTARETGILSFTSTKSKGTNQITANSTVGRISTRQAKLATLLEMQNKKDEILRKEPKYNSSFSVYTQDKGKLAPIFDPHGNVTDYHYLMEHKTKDVVLERNNNFEDIIGSIASSQFDKTSTQIHNDEVIKALNNFFNKDYINNKNAYVEFSERSQDPELQEAYRLLPSSTKKTIRDVWGNDAMFIRNDLLDMITGYRHMSLSDVFSKDKNHQNVAEQVLVDMTKHIWGNKAANKVRRAEDKWKEVVALTKDIVVVRNLWTLVGNTTSNATMLFWKGLTPIQIIKYQTEAADRLNDYQKISNRLLKLTNKVGTVGSIQEEQELRRKIHELKFKLERNPVHGLVEAGLFQTIVEDIDEDTTTERYKSPFEQMVDKQIDKLPESIRKAGEIAFVGKNTSIHKLLSKATQMSDFMARYAAYKVMTTKGLKGKIYTHEETVTDLRELFVNYDALTHKKVKYANQIGLMMFTKYYIRTQKQIFKLMGESPLRGLGLAVTDNYIDNLSSIIDSGVLSRGLGNPLDPGAFAILGASDEPIPISMLLGIFK